jgi:DNA-binding protein H-NS
MAGNSTLMDLMAASMAVIAHRFIIEIGADRGGKVAGLWGAIGSDNFSRWEAIKLALPSMPVKDLLRLCLDCALIAEHKTDQYRYKHDPECMIAVAEKLGLDAEALFQAEKNAQKAAEQAKKSPKTKKTKPVTSGEAPYPSEAAQAQDLNRDENPDGAPEAAPAGEETAKEGHELPPASAGGGDEKPPYDLTSLSVGDTVYSVSTGEGGEVNCIYLDGRPAPIVVMVAGDERCFEKSEIKIVAKGTQQLSPATAGEVKENPADECAAITSHPRTVMYRHPEEATLGWSGRGRKPKWVEHCLAQGVTLDSLKSTGATA